MCKYWSNSLKFVSRKKLNEFVLISLLLTLISVRCGSTVLLILNWIFASWKCTHGNWIQLYIYFLGDDTYAWIRLQLLILWGLLLCHFEIKAKINKSFFFHFLFGTSKYFNISDYEMVFGFNMPTLFCFVWLYGKCRRTYFMAVKFQFFWVVCKKGIWEIERL